MPLAVGWMLADICRDIPSSMNRRLPGRLAGPRSLAAPGPGPRAPMQPQGQEVRSPGRADGRGSLAGSQLLGCRQPLGGSRPVLRGSPGGPLLGRIIRRSDLNVTRFIKFFYKNI